MSDKKIIDKDTVLRVARLSRLILSDKELSQYSGQLGAILEYIDQLNEIDTRNTPPTSHPLSNLKNVFREDRVKGSLSPADVLRNAPRKKENFFSVPRVIE
ncbi:MAG: Asp-tRNA(Asn)/Glu-tRNA(Gln) amidotransferase subunit GatC [Candidatus Omnitrophica bacterium]|nr:Asp-tRNA(Asn)/Glu-tRNA(Gln) amidotransferase subunit GatC [Candidatus Omnitrophota bacterium]